MERLFRVFSVVLGVVTLLMFASPCYSHTAGGGGHSSGGHGYHGHGYHGHGYQGHGYHGRTDFGRTDFGRGDFGYRNWHLGWWWPGGWQYDSGGGSDPYYGGYASDYAGSYPYDSGYYPDPYYGGYPYDYGHYPAETSKADQQTLEQKDNGSKEMVVLKPTWVISGETTVALDGNLRIVIHKASNKDECQKDSTAVSYLTSDTDIKKLCLLRTGEAENFTYQGKNYLFNLSGIAAQASVYRYYISISLERE